MLFIFSNFVFFIFRFDGVKRKIERKYDEIERALIEEFVNEQSVGNLKRMQEIAAVLSDFKNYTHCIDAFIEQSQEVGAFYFTK